MKAHLNRAFITIIMIKPLYYFATSEDINIISDKSTCGEMYLSALIGQTLSSMMRDKNCPLELVRINRGQGMVIVAMRRFNDIRVTTNERK